jgi:hypothetical protein
MSTGSVKSFAPTTTSSIAAARKIAPEAKTAAAEVNFVVVPLLTNRATRQLLADCGGVEPILAATTVFYEKFFRDLHLRPFLGDLHYPLAVHAKRLALYIAEMMGDSSAPWTHDIKSCPFRATDVALATGETVRVQARSEAHYAAWHSVKRSAEHVGRRFKLDDCRVWMRLFFWSCREACLSERFPVLFDYLIRWVGHFIRFYETTAQPFTRLESRWSLEPRNVERYQAQAFYMKDVVGVALKDCADMVPDAELHDAKWPYVGDRKIAFEE